MARFGKFIIGFSYWVVGLVFSAYVFSILFGWFIVPLGLPAISVAQAFGIRVLTMLLAYRYKEEESKTERGQFFNKVCEVTSVHLILSIMLLTLGWVATIFM